MKFTKILINCVAKYLLGFLIVFMSSILVAAAANKSIKNYIIERSEMKIREGIGSISETIAKMDLINQIISKNKTFTGVVYQRGQIPQNEILKLKDADQMFTEIGFAADDIPYIFMLFKNNDLYVSTSQCSFHFDDYYNKFLQITNNGTDISDSEKLRQFLFDRYYRGDSFIKTERISYTYSGRRNVLNEALLYVTTGDYTGLSPMYVSCFVIDRTFLVKNIMMPELKDHGFLYIQNMKTGEVLLQYGDVPEGAAECLNGQTIGNNAYHVIVSTQEDLQWKIVTGVPMAFIASQTWPVSRLLLLYLCIGMFLVIALTLYFSLKQYAGIRKVLFALPDHSAVQTEIKGFDEYRLLTDGILRLKKKGNDDRLRMEALAGQNEAILLEHLLIMGIRTPQERSAFEKCFEREPEFFCVAIVRSNQKERYRHEIITMRMVEYLRTQYGGKFTNVYSGVMDELFLVELNPEQEANVSGIKKLFEEMTSLITTNYNVTFHVGISAIGTDISNINRCYEQARQIVQAQYACADENLVGTYDITVNALYENPVNLDFLNRFYTLLVCGRQQEIQQLFKQIGHYYSRMPYLYELQKEQVFYSIRNILYTAWLNLSVEAGGTEKFPMYSSGLTCNGMIAAFQENSARICEHISQTKKSKNEGLRQKIIDYLGRRYQDAGLSAYSASREIGISEKYLSRFMKEQTGETFSAYVLRIRIDKAKEYLETTDYSNDKIAELTGFAAMNTFYRNFNKQTGVTPKVYKETHQNLL